MDIVVNNPLFTVTVGAFAHAFIASIGRCFLTKKPPELALRFVDALLCGVFAVPVAGLAYTEHNLTVWHCWISAFVFGTLGFINFRKVIGSAMPDLKQLLIVWLTGGKR